ncbi:phosphatase [Vibrio hannami]|uniref:phosphatase n=1 Tax=Vibrio hannami TaxID=2717094 RepID=UPI00240F9F91|nr:phosphatase [Vibrio hannami]MDG3085397.1 phosphatase [Vibrio hannami]
MKLEVDTHTHTLASGHAYSTIIENAKAAKENGLKMFCTTDHADSMPGAPHYWFFMNQTVLPRFLSDVAVIRGIESNILNELGEVDINPRAGEKLDWAIASFHEPVFAPKNKAVHTRTLINVIKSGRVDALGHLGNPSFDFDFEEVIGCAKEHNVAIEINASSLKGHSRVGSIERCYKIAEVVRDLGAYITTGSDAHFCDAIGKLELAEKLLESVDMPSEQIITTSPRQFLDFLELRGHKEIEEYSNF